jgi:hypothetical protein
MPAEIGFDPPAPLVVTAAYRARLRQRRQRRLNPGAVAAAKSRYNARPENRRKSNRHRRWRYEHNPE